MKLMKRTGGALRRQHLPKAEVFQCDEEKRNGQELEGDQQPNGLFFFFFFYGLTHGIWTFPGRGWSLSHSCNLHHRCGNTGPFTPQHRARDEPVPPQGPEPQQSGP